MVELNSLKSIRIILLRTVKDSVHTGRTYRSGLHKLSTDFKFASCSPRIVSGTSRMGSVLLRIDTAREHTVAAAVGPFPGERFDPQNGYHFHHFHHSWLRRHLGRPYGLQLNQLREPFLLQPCPSSHLPYHPYRLQELAVGAPILVALVLVGVELVLLEL